jgi:hypothetical protein
MLELDQVEDKRDRQQRDGEERSGTSRNARCTHRRDRASAPLKPRPSRTLIGRET